MGHSIRVTGATVGIVAWHVASVAAGSGLPMHAVTRTAMAAVQGPTRSLAAELTPAIKANRLAPRLTRVPPAAAVTTGAVIHVDGGRGAVAGTSTVRFGASGGVQASA